MISESLDAKIKLETEDEWTKLTDLGLIVARGIWPRATPKTSYLEVPGGDGKIDLSDVLRGDAVFNNVTGTLELIVLRPDRFDVHDFANHYSGRRVMVRMGDDDDYFRVGRCWISADDRKKVLRKLTMTFDAEPYRYALAERTVEIPLRQTRTLTKSDWTWVSGSITSGNKYENGYGEDDEPKSDYADTPGGLNTNGGYGVVKTSVKPHTLYNLSFKYNDNRCAVTLWWDEKQTLELHSPRYFNSGEHTELFFYVRSLIASSSGGWTSESVTDIKLTPAIDDVVVRGRRFVTPVISGGHRCKLVSELSYVDASTIGVRQIWMHKTHTVTVVNSGYSMYGEYDGQYWWMTNSTYRLYNQGVAIVDFASGKLLTKNTLNSATNVDAELRFVSTLAEAKEKGGNYIGDFFTLSDTQDDGQKLDFSLKAGLNQIMAINDYPGGKMRLTFREGYL